MCLDCSTKSKVNINPSLGISLPRSGFPRTPRTPVERKIMLSILSDLSSPTSFPDPPHRQLSYLTETLPLPHPSAKCFSKAQRSYRAKPLNAPCINLFNRQRHGSPFLTTRFYKDLTLKEKLMTVLMLIADFLSIYKSDTRSQPTNNSIPDEVNKDTLDFHHQKSALSSSSTNISEGSRGLSFSHYK
jgi:hypothetical protein